ncbi:MAG: exodeoxyribonuclease VII small subunit [Bdellovibrionaceae bacterium]|nr:exodeoxyribonuclease VII small subunit [Pseudobdellovibrionaceae bacterium]
MDFEKQIKEVEKINEEISSGNLSLKDSISAFKKGLSLISSCKKELTQAEESVKKLVGVDEETGDVQTEDFNPE